MSILSGTDLETPDREDDAFERQVRAGYVGNFRGSSGVRFIRLRRLGHEFIAKGDLHCRLGNPPPTDPSASCIYSEWSWNGSHLTVKNDRYGMYPLYYYTSKNEIALSNSIPHLLELGAPRQIDHTALSIFLRTGYFIGDHTAFKAIRVVPCNVALTWNGEDLNIVNSPAVVRHQRMSMNVAVDGYIELFRQAIRRVLPDPGSYIMPISGGMDSRHILLELLHQSRAPHACITVGAFTPASDQDVAIATQVTNALNLPHVVLKANSDRLSAEIDKNFRTSYCSREHYWAMGMVKYISNKGLNTYDGLAGDVLSSGLFVNSDRLGFINSERVADLANDFLGTADRERMLHNILSPAFYDLISREKALETFEEHLEKHLDAPNPIGSFILASRTAIIYVTEQLWGWPDPRCT